MEKLKQLIANEKTKYNKVRDYVPDILDFVEDGLKSKPNKDSKLFFEDSLWNAYHNYLESIGALTVLTIALINFNHDIFTQNIKDNFNTKESVFLELVKKNLAELFDDHDIPTNEDEILGLISRVHKGITKCSAKAFKCLADYNLSKKEFDALNKGEAKPEFVNKIEKYVEITSTLYGKIVQLWDELEEISHLVQEEANNNTYSKSTESKEENYLVIKVTWSDYPNKLSRTIVINENESLNSLATSLLIAFRTACYHLYQFEINNVIYELPNEDADFMYSKEERKDSNIRIKDANIKGKFKFIYDFGDYWEFELEVIDHQTKTTDSQIPECIEAIGYGIADDNKFPLIEYFENKGMKLEEIPFVVGKDFGNITDFNKVTVKQINSELKKNFNKIQKAYNKFYMN